MRTKKMTYRILSLMLVFGMLFSMIPSFAATEETGANLAASGSSLPVTGDEGISAPNSTDPNNAGSDSSLENGPGSGDGQADTTQGTPDGNPAGSSSSMSEATPTGLPDVTPSGMTDIQIIYGGLQTTALLPIVEQRYDAGETLILADLLGDYSQDPESKGRVFDGWMYIENNELQGKVGEEFTIPADFASPMLVLVPIWKANGTIAITYNGLEDTTLLPVDTTMYNPGDVVTLRDLTGDYTQDAQAQGVFGGWAATTLFGALYKAGETFTIPADFTGTEIALTIHWKQEAGTVRIIYGGLEDANLLPRDNTAYALGATVTAKGFLGGDAYARDAGCEGVFDGWILVGLDTIVAVGDTFTIPETFEGTEMYLMPNWKVNPFLRASTILRRYVAEAGNDSTGDGSAGKPFKTIGKAYAGIVTNTVITVVGNVTVSGFNDVSAAGDITLTQAVGTIGKLNRASGYRGTLLSAMSGATLTIRDLTFDGNDVAAVDALIGVDGGTLTLDKGTVLQRNKNDNTTNPLYGGGALRVYTGGTVNIKKDVLILFNAARIGSAIAQYGGTVNMEDGSLADNYAVTTNATGSTGALHIEGGVFNLTGGRIAENKGAKDGGAATVFAGATLNISGGEITKNTSNDSGAIKIDGGLVQLSGGKIYRNTGTNANFGGGVYISSGTLALSKDAYVAENVSKVISNGEGIYNNGGTVNLVGTTTDKALLIFDNETPITVTNGATITSLALGTSSFQYYSNLEFVKEGSVTSGTFAWVVPKTIGTVYYLGKNSAPGSAANDAYNGLTSATPFATLAKALTVIAATANASTQATIIVQDNISITGPLPTNLKGATVLVNGTAHTFQSVNNSSSTTWHLQNAKITLRNLMWKGSPTYQNSYGEFFVDTNSTLTLDYGARIQGVKNRAVNVRPTGTLIMNPGSEIFNSVAGLNGAYDNLPAFDYYGGGVFSAGTVIMNGGSIHDNVANQAVSIYAKYNRGGGMTLMGGTANFTMNGGTITNNKVMGDLNANYDAHGAGIFANSATMVINGGSIEYNQGVGSQTVHGGGIFAEYSGLTLNGGNISGNEATHYSAIYISGVTTINGGIIGAEYPKPATTLTKAELLALGGNYSSGVASATFQNITINGGKIVGNNAQSTTASNVQVLGTIDIKGNPVIRNNWSGLNTTTGERNLQTSKLINVTGNLDGANIGVYQANGLTPIIDGQAGTVAAGLTPTGLENVVADSNNTLVLTQSGNKLIWGSGASEAYISASGLDTNTGSEFSPIRTLAKAYEKVGNGGTIYVLGEVPVNNNTMMSNVTRAFTITGTGAGSKLIRRSDTGAATGNTYGKNMFTVGNGGNVTIKNLIIDGGAVWNNSTVNRTNSGLAIVSDISRYGSLIRVESGGTVTLQSGAILQNAELNSGSYYADIGAGVYLNGGTLNMGTGAVISDMKTSGYAADGAAVSSPLTSSTFNMTGGLITRSSGERIGSAIRWSTGVFTMTGGEISGNFSKYSANDNAAVYVGGGVVKIGGSAVIKDNVAGGVTRNLYSVGNSSLIQLVSNLTGDAYIGLTGYSSGIGTTVVGSVDASVGTQTSVNYADRIRSDDGAAKGVRSGVNGAGTTIVWADNRPTDVYISNSGADTNEGTAASPYRSLKKAGDMVVAGGIIHVMDTVLVNTAQNLPLNSKTVTIVGEDESGNAYPNAALKRDSDNVNQLIQTTGTTALALEAVIFDGNKSLVTATSALVGHLATGKLDLKAGTKFINNNNTGNTYMAGGVYVQAATVDMASGVEFSNNEAFYGSAITLNNGTLNMSGGIMKGNHTTATTNDGGAIHIGIADIKITGGSIVGNSADYIGAAIQGYYSGTYSIDIDGTTNPVIIQGNVAKNVYGGAIYARTTNLKITGNVQISGNRHGVTSPRTSRNENGAATGGVESNIYLENGYSVRLGTTLSGKIGLYNVVTPTEGQVVATSVSGTAPIATDLNNITSDRNAQYTGVRSGASTNIVWGFVLRDAVYVKSTGDDTKDGTTVANAVKTIATAIKLVKDGGTIHVVDAVPVTAAGTTKDKSFTIQSATAKSGSLYRDGSYTGSIIDIKNATTGVITLSNITLHGNNALAYNPLISVLGINSTVNTTVKVVLASGTTLKDNKNTQGGIQFGVYNVAGGVFLDNATLEMSGDATIENCEAQYGAGVTMWGNSIVTMTGGIIKNNRAIRTSGDGGGGIYAYYNTNKITLDGAKLLGNSTKYWGGAIFTYDLNNNLVIKGNTLIQGNVAAFEGGAISVAGGTIKVSGAPVILGNQVGAVVVPSMSGDATGGKNDNVYIAATPLQIDGSLSAGAKIGVTTGTHAAGQKAVMMSNNSVVNSPDSLFFVYDRGTYAILKNTGDGKSMDLTLQTEYYVSTAIGSDTLGNGTVDAPYKTIQHAYDSVPAGNTTAISIRLMDNQTITQTITMSGSKKVYIVNNTGTTITRGGSFTGDMFKITAGEVYFWAVTLDGNAVTGVTGSLINVSSGLLTLDGTILQNNHTSANGGGLHVGASAKAALLDTATIRNNKTITAHPVNSQEWVAAGGGGIYLEGGATLPSVPETVVISGNKTNAQGGGIYASTAGGTIAQITNFKGTIENNEAANGGGVYLNGARMHTLSEAKIQNNRATGAFGGGGVYVNGATFTLQGKVTGNTSASYGGGVTVDWAQAAAKAGVLQLLFSGEISGNTAVTAGGGVYRHPNSATAYASTEVTLASTVTIKNNTVSGVANNIYLLPNQTLKLSGDGTGSGTIGVTVDSAALPMAGTALAIATGAATNQITGHSAFVYDDATATSLTLGNKVVNGSNAVVLMRKNDDKTLKKLTYTRPQDGVIVPLALLSATESSLTAWTYEIPYEPLKGSVTFKATPNSATAVIDAVSAGAEATFTINFTAGEDPADQVFTVTAEDGTTQTYTIRFTRGTQNPKIIAYNYVSDGAGVLVTSIEGVAYTTESGTATFDMGTGTITNTGNITISSSSTSNTPIVIDGEAITATATSAGKITVSVPNEYVKKAQDNGTITWTKDDTNSNADLDFFEYFEIYTYAYDGADLIGQLRLYLRKVSATAKKVVDDALNVLNDPSTTFAAGYQYKEDADAALTPPLVQPASFTGLNGTTTSVVEGHLKDYVRQQAMRELKTVPALVSAVFNSDNSESSQPIADFKVTVETVDFIAPIEGDPNNTAGSNGRYTFTIIITYGAQSRTDERSIVINARGFDGASTDDLIDELTKNDGELIDNNGDPMIKATIYANPGETQAVLTASVKTAVQDLIEDAVNEITTIGTMTSFETHVYATASSIKVTLEGATYYASVPVRAIKDVSLAVTNVTVKIPLDITVVFRPFEQDLVKTAVDAIINTLPYSFDDSTVGKTQIELRALVQAHIEAVLAASLTSITIDRRASGEVTAIPATVQIGTGKPYTVTAAVTSLRYVAGANGTVEDGEGTSGEYIFEAAIRLNTMNGTTIKNTQTLPLAVAAFTHTATSTSIVASNSSLDNGIYLAPVAFVGLTNKEATDEAKRLLETAVFPTVDLHYHERNDTNVRLHAVQDWVNSVLLGKMHESTALGVTATVSLQESMTLFADDSSAASTASVTNLYQVALAKGNTSDTAAPRASFTHRQGAITGTIPATAGEAPFTITIFNPDGTVNWQSVTDTSGHYVIPASISSMTAAPIIITDKTNHKSGKGAITLPMDTTEELVPDVLTMAPGATFAVRVTDGGTAVTSGVTLKAGTITTHTQVGTSNTYIITEIPTTPVSVAASITGKSGTAKYPTAANAQGIVNIALATGSVTTGTVAGLASGVVTLYDKDGTAVGTGTINPDGSYVVAPANLTNPGFTLTVAGADLGGNPKSVVVASMTSAQVADLTITSGDIKNGALVTGGINVSSGTSIAITTGGIGSTVYPVTKLPTRYFITGVPESANVDMVLSGKKNGNDMYAKVKVNVAARATTGTATPPILSDADLIAGQHVTGTLPANKGTAPFTITLYPKDGGTPITVTTDANGNFDLLIPDGDYTVLITDSSNPSKNGSGALTIPQATADGAGDIIEAIELQYGFVVSGIVSLNGTPKSGATVTQTAASLSSITDANGKYVLAGIPAASTLIATYTTNSGSVRVTAATTTANINMVTGGVATGKLPSGVNLQDGIVKIYDKDGKLAGTGVVNADGTYAIAPVIGQGTYTLTVEGKNDNGEAISAVFTPATLVDPAMTANDFKKGVLVTGTSNADSISEVTFIGADGEPNIGKSTGNRYFGIAPVAEEINIVLVGKIGSDDAVGEAKATVTSGITTLAGPTITMTLGQRISGKVDPLPSGLELPAVMFILNKATGQVIETTIDVRGNYNVLLPDGEYTVGIVSENGKTAAFDVTIPANNAAAVNTMLEGAVFANGSLLKGKVNGITTGMVNVSVAHKTTVASATSVDMSKNTYFIIPHVSQNPKNTVMAMTTTKSHSGVAMTSTPTDALVEINMVSGAILQLGPITIPGSATSLNALSATGATVTVYDAATSKTYTGIVGSDALVVIPGFVPNGTQSSLVVSAADNLGRTGKLNTPALVDDDDSDGIWAADPPRALQIRPAITGKIIGAVTDADNYIISGATVALFYGEIEQASAVTDALGKFEFNDLPYGIYKLVVTTTDNRIQTFIEQVNAPAQDYTLELPAIIVVDGYSVATQAVVEQSGDDTPAVAAHIPDGVFDELIDQNETALSHANGGVVQVRLDAKQLDAAHSSAERTKIKAMAGANSNIEALIDFTLSKTITLNGAPTKSALSEVPSPIEIMVEVMADTSKTPLNTLSIWRVHNGGMGERLGSGGESFKFKEINGKNWVLIKARKFSSYAIVYTPVVLPSTPTPGPMTGTAVIDVTSSNVNDFMMGDDLVFDVSGTPDVHRIEVNIDPSVMSDKSEGDTVLKTARMIVRMPNARWKGLETVAEGQKLRLVLDDSQLLFDITKGEKSVYEYNHNKPIRVEIKFDLTANQNPDNVVVYELVNGKKQLIHRSGYENGWAYAMVYTHGQYVVEYRDTIKFTDTTDEMYTYLALHGVAVGTGKGKFEPTLSLTRAEYTVMLMNMLAPTVSTTTSMNFKDQNRIPTWASERIKQARILGIVVGDSKGNFNPSTKITREEMLTMSYRAMRAFGMIGQPKDNTNLQNFSDSGKVASYAKEAVSALANAKLQNSKLLTPQQVMTRGDAASLLYGICIAERQYAKH